MSTIRDRKSELENFETAQLITAALRDISAVELQRIKKEFEKGQSYYREIENLYRLIKMFAEKENIKTNIEDHSTMGTLFVAITSNRRLYGSINNEIMRVFEEQMKKNQQNSFYYVIGRIGKEYLEGTLYKARCKFFEFKEDEPTPYENIVFIDATRHFENVFIFYPKFVNVFKQEITLRDIAYVPELPKKETPYIDYIFEPELGEIFWFFETQVRYILFNQILLEVKLARIAARLLSMSVTEQTIFESVMQKKRLFLKALNTFANMRLLETFASITQWNRNL